MKINEHFYSFCKIIWLKQSDSEKVICVAFT